MSNFYSKINGFSSVSSQKRGYVYLNCSVTSLYNLFYQSFVDAFYENVSLMHFMKYKLLERNKEDQHATLKIYLKLLPSPLMCY